MNTFYRVTVSYCSVDQNEIVHEVSLIEARDREHMVYKVQDQYGMDSIILKAEEAHVNKNGRAYFTS